MKKGIALILFACIGIIANGQINFETSDWASVQQKAKKSGKIIFLEGYTSWCGWCKWMDKNTFTDKEVGNLFNKYFVNYKLDMEKDPGTGIAKELGINGYPTFVFYDSEMNPIHIEAGALKAVEMIMLAKKVIELPDDKQFYRMKKQYQAGDDSKQLLYNYTVALYQFGNKSYPEVFEKYRKTLSKEDMLTLDNWNLFKEIVNNYESEVYLFIKENRDYYAKLSSVKEVDQYLLSVEFDYYADKEMWDNYWKAATVLIENYDYFDGSQLNNIAWTCYENIDDKMMLKSALEWAERSVALDKNYYNLDTHAHLLYKLGQYKKALEQAETAIELAKEGKMEYDVTEELVKKIKEKI